MPHDFLGIGWSFPAAARDAAESAPLFAEAAHYEESVRQSIWIILSTARGERVMRPDFGCGIHDLVFALDTPSAIGMAQFEVEQALLYWEPRINVINVTVDTDRRAEADAGSLATAYSRFLELESRRRFRALPHAMREKLRGEFLAAGAEAAGPETTTLSPAGADDRILERIGKNEVPPFEVWCRERKEQLSGPGLLIAIDYAVKATNSRFNVVYPFYLERRPANV